MNPSEARLPEKRARSEIEGETIRSATANDAVAIAEIHVKGWRVAYQGMLPADFLAGISLETRTASWKKHIAEKASTLLVHDHEGRVAAWISSGPSRDEDCAGRAEVYAIYVDPVYWGNGCGRELLKAAESHLGGHGEVTLWVLKENGTARRFYEAAGYQADGAEKSCEIGGVSVLEIRLRKRMEAVPQPVARRFWREIRPIT